MTSFKAKKANKAAARILRALLCFFFLDRHMVYLCRGARKGSDPPNAACGAQASD